MTRKKQLKMDSSKQKLEINIIDKEKNDRSLKPKQIVFSIVTFLVILVITFGRYRYHSFDTIYINSIMILIVSVLAALGIAYKFKVSSKGTIIFEEDRIIVLSKIVKTDVMIPGSNAIILYQFFSNDAEGEEELKYIYELNHLQKKYLLELDIVFKYEKDTFENLKIIWKNKGADVQIINTPPNSR